jgi:type II secretory pathway pseudopilin PulG
MVVVSIMILVAAFVGPAVTSLKSANDVVSAAYTVKGVLEQARTYAMANNTYAWVGFYEEDASQPSTTPATPGNGRLVMSVVASIDGTKLYTSGTSGPLDPTNTKLRQVTKLVKIDNVHLPLFAINTSGTTGDTFDTRPPIQSDPTAGYNYSRFGELNNPTPNTAPYTTPLNFGYPIGGSIPQYTFNKLFQFSPSGEGRVNWNDYNIRAVVEIGLVQTHANSVPAPTSGAGTSTASYSGNVTAVQISGFGNVKIYRR